MRAVFLALFVPSIAFAGGNQDSAVTQLEYGREHDAASDRAYLSSTAITPSEGTWTYSLRQPLLPASFLTVGYAVSDRVLVTAGLGVPLTEAGSTLGSGSVLVQVARGDSAALAVQTGIYGSRDGEMTYASVIGTVCWSERECAATATGYVTASLVPGGDRIAITGGGSIAIGGDSAKFLLEGDGFSDDASTDRLYMGMAGVRIPGRRWSYDGGLGVVVLPPDAEVPVIPVLLFDATLRM